MMTPIEITTEMLLGPLNEVETKHAPKRLYAVGDTQMLRYASRVSIVGSREASSDGLRRAKKLSIELAERGVVIVSGLAMGIDAAAHTATLSVGGKTTAVIGTGLDKSYPKRNAWLQNQLMEEQLVLSQFALGYPIQPRNFPIRNRTMALISDATVIIEAGETSGSLSQGWEALRLGRPLFIAESVVSNPNLQWPSHMLGYGAYVLSDVTDVLALLPERNLAESNVAAAI